MTTPHYKSYEILKGDLFIKDWISCSSEIGKSSAYNKTRENLTKINLQKVIEPGTICSISLKGQSTHSILVLESYFVKEYLHPDLIEELVLIIYYNFKTKTITYNQIHMENPIISNIF